MAESREQRVDDALRSIFVEAFNLASPYMDGQGQWLSQAHECLANDALAKRFPSLTDMRLMAVLATVSGVRASGRVPVD